MVEFFVMLGFLVAVLDLVDMDAIFHLAVFDHVRNQNVGFLMTRLKSFAMPWNLQKCSFPGITHISEKISRCCKRQKKAMHSLHIMH